MMKIKIIKKRSKKKKLRKNLMLAGLSVALLSQPVMAETKKWTFHEEKWKDVKAYGRTIISEDSAREWGPWTEFIQPAAGPTPVAALPQISVDGPSYFRPESANEYSPKYTQPVLSPPHVSGEWQGYAAYRNSEYGYGEGYYSNEYGPSIGRIGLRLSPNNPDTVTVNGGAGEGIVSYRITNLDGAPVYQSGDIGAEFYNGLSDFDADAYTSDESTYSSEEIEGYPPYDTETWNAIPGGQVTTGWFWNWNESYDGYYSYDGGEGWGVFVAGIPTPLSDIANLQAGNVTAHYYGYSFGGSPVHFEVNFLPGTWSGSGNNGMDGSTWTYTDDNGTKYVGGDVGFRAEGTINGADIQSTRVWADDGNVSSGEVKGNFMGSNANVLGGGVDITKTTEGYDNAKYVDVFVACKGTECAPTSSY